MNEHGRFADRLTRGIRWAWSAERYRAGLPSDLAESAMSIDSRDRFHAKQGRTTARVRFDAPGGPISVFLKRHDGLPWPSRIAALVNPGGNHTPATTEWRHLESARSLGIPVPEVVAAGEEIGPWGKLRGFLMVAELIGADEVNRVIPELQKTLDVQSFARIKREIAIEMAEIAAKLHANRCFHKDLYLCHYFLDASQPRGGRLTLIDLHRLAKHRLFSYRWRWKDLGQLLFSTHGVPGVESRDCLRFWMHYRRLMRLRYPRLEAKAVQAKAARYLAHNS